MSRASDLQDKLDKGMNMLYDNLPDDVAIFTYVYVRDKSDRSKKDPDGKTNIRYLSKNCNNYDGYVASIDLDKMFKGII